MLRGGSISVKACSRELIAYLCFLFFFNTPLNKLLPVRGHDGLHDRCPGLYFQEAVCDSFQIKPKMDESEINAVKRVLALTYRRGSR